MPATLTGLAARILAGTRLCAVRAAEAGGERVIVKRRYAYAAVPILAARVLPARLRVLSVREWLEWEPEVYRRAYGAAVVAGPGPCLHLPAWPGVPLAAWLAEPAALVDDRLGALAAATRELRRLHALPVRYPDGGVRLFSHGDATVRNAVYDSATGKVHWFDFETIHTGAHPPAWRHADDLRALAYSAAVVMDITALGPAAEAIVAAYADASVRSELAGMIACGRAHRDPFQLAQAPLTGPKRAAFEAALRCALAHAGDRPARDMG